MFEHDMREKQEKHVTIDDSSSSTIKGLLELIYTDTVLDVTTLAPELLGLLHMVSPENRFLSSIYDGQGGYV